MRKPSVLLALSIVLVSGIPWLSYLGYRLIETKARENPYFTVRAIVPVAKNGLAVKTALLAEHLGLSIDRQKNLYSLSLAHLEKKLLSDFVFTSVKIERLRPSMLRIEYELRKPLFRLISQENTLIDEEGVLFPEFPYFTPKRAVEVLLPQKEPLPWGEKVKEEELSLLLEFYRLYGEGGRLERIDLSEIFHPSLGQREIIVEIGSTFYRFSPKNWRERIPDLNKIVEMKAKVVDFRIDDIALISK